MRRLTRNNNDLLIDDPAHFRAASDAGAPTSSFSVDILTQRLHDLQFYTRSLIESSLDPIMTTDVNGTITDVNRQMIDLAGRTRDELLGAPCRILFTNPERADALIDRVLSFESIVDFELIIRSFSGAEVEMSFNASTLHDRERAVYGVFAAARDVTNTKQMERALREKNEKLEEMNESRAEYLKTAQTDILDPLANIVAESSAMAAGVDGELTGSQRARIDRIHRQSETLLSLLGDLIGLSRTSRDSAVLEFVEIDVQAVLDVAVNGRIPPGGSVAAAVWVDPGLHSFCADAAKLNDVLEILVSNALQAVEGRGHIEVRASLVDSRVAGNLDGSRPSYIAVPRTSAGGHSLQITVSDAGMGINELELPRIFLTPRPTGDPPHRQFAGHGTGLATLKLLVDAQGGVLGVESLVGSGSAFTVWLPERAASHSSGFTTPKLTTQ